MPTRSHLVDGGSDDGPEGAEDEPDWRRHQGEADEVDVVVDGVQDAGKQEPKRGPQAGDREGREAAWKGRSSLGQEISKGVKMFVRTMRLRTPFSYLTIDLHSLTYQVQQTHTSPYGPKSLCLGFELP